MHKPILVIIAGSVGSQLIMLVGMTYAASALGPEAFGLYALVFAFAAPIGLIGTLRLETTFIHLDDGPRVALAGLTGLVSMAIVALLVLLAGLAVRQPDVVYVALLAFFLGANAKILNLSNYRRQFLKLTAVRILIALATLLSLVVTISLEVPDALTLATIAGQAIGTIAGLAMHFDWTAENYRSPSIGAMTAVIRENVAFSVFNGVQSLFSALQETVIVVILTSFLGVASVGVYSIAQRILYAPISVASEALGRVLQVEIRANKNADRNVRRQMIDRLLMLLALAAAALAFGILFFAAPVMGLILGPEWAQLDTLLPAMSFYMAALFVGATVAIFPLALGQPRAVSMFGVFGTSLYVFIVFASLALGATLAATYWVVSAIMPIYFVFFVAKVRSVVAG